MLKRISARLFALILLLSMTAIGGCASFDGGSLFSSLSWGGAPGGQTEPELVYEDVRMNQSEPD